MCSGNRHPYTRASVVVVPVAAPELLHACVVMKKADLRPLFTCVL